MDEDGVTFRSHIDGTKPPPDARAQHRHPAPARRRHHHVLRRMHALPGHRGPRPRQSMRLSMRWAARCREAFVPREGHGLFGIVQGGVLPGAAGGKRGGADRHRLRGLRGRRPRGRRGPGGDVRGARLHRAAAAGRPRRATSWASARPADIVGAVRRGVDMFDCVIPTRSGRTGRAYTSRGVLNLRNARHADDAAPARPRLRLPRLRPPLPRLPPPPDPGGGDARPDAADLAQHAATTRT